LFWWRAQVTKFLFRPRPSLLRYADNMRRETFPNGTIPHPLKSLHIRHGDKAKEAGLIPVSAYMKMIEDEQLKEKYGARSIFLSTEDPESVDDLLREYNTTWDIYYTKVPRFNLSPLGSMERIGPERETLISFSQLLLAVEADFFSFGTNDLTQMTCGFSRDDSAVFLKEYVAQKIYKADPFQSIDQTGVGKIMQICVNLARSTKLDIDIGICGEHGGDPQSVEFCHRIGLDNVSCSPFRVPIARLAAAQAAIKYGPTPKRALSALVLSKL